MKNVGFISDYFKESLLGGGELNDGNLINYLQTHNQITKIESSRASIDEISKLDSLIIGNFVLLNEEVKNFIIKEKKYIIYEHDHKYVNTRDPSKFSNFKIPLNNIINKNFYENSYYTVVLSNICKKVLQKNLPNVKVHNISCSLWSENTFEFIQKINDSPKQHDLCIMKSSNPTKNYNKAVEYCNSKNISYGEIHSDVYQDFLIQMSKYNRMLFIPSVLETFSRLCAEAKMLNLDVMTNKNMIGFFSEDYSHLKGSELIEVIRLKNKEAYKFFEEVV